MADDDVEHIQFTDAGGKTMDLVRYEGRLWPRFLPEAIRGVRGLKSREDDIIVVAYPKSGTHWVWEIVRFLLAGTTDVPQDNKGSGMIELIPPEQLEALPSPRALNTHAHFELMPSEVVAKKDCKLIYVTRDPRDVAVSFFNHHLKLNFYYSYEGTWQDYYHLHLEGKVDYESWFTYTRGWEQGLKDNPEFNVHVTSYEALKENTSEEVERLALFLGASTDKDFLADVIEKTSFDSMLAAKSKDAPERLLEGGGHVMYRKGKVGDWKNWFTVAQAEHSDAVFEQEMKGTKAYELYSNFRKESNESLSTETSENEK